MPSITDIAEFVNEDWSVDIGCTAIAGPIRSWSTNSLGNIGRIRGYSKNDAYRCFPIKKLEMIKSSIIQQGIESMYI